MRKENKVLLVADCVASLSVNNNVWLRLPDAAEDPEKRKDVIKFCGKLEEEYPGKYVFVGIGNMQHDYKDGKLLPWNNFAGFGDDPRSQYEWRNILRDGGEIIEPS